MFKKGIFLISIFIFLVLSIGFASASNDFNETDVLSIDSGDADSLSIDNDNLNELQIDEKSVDEKLGSDISGNTKIKTSSSKTFEDMQRYIDKSHNGDVIKVASNYVGTGKAIKIDKSITIQGTGKGATFDAKKLSRIFYITGNVKVTLKNLKLVNALEKERKGGAIYSTASKLNIYKCSFKNNGALSAGDMYIAGGKCTVKQSTFKYGYYYLENPEGDMIDGYTFPREYSSIINKGVSSFYRCSFMEGSHYIYSNKKCTFNKCTFKELAFSALTLKGTNTIKNCKFTKNYGESYEDSGVGGISPYYYIIEIRNGKTTISNSNFVKNDAKVIHITKSATCKLINTKFKDNYGSEYGYMIHKTVLNFGKLYITKDKKTTKHIPKGHELLGDSLKPVPFTSPSKATISFNSKKTVNFKHYGKYLIGARAKLKVWTGKEYKTFKSQKPVNGVFKFNIRGVNVGTYKFKLIIGTSTKEGKLIINKAKTSIKAPKVTFKANKTNYFKATIKNKESKKLINGIKVNITVFTGNTFKSYIVKTNNGIASLNTKNLSKGLHKITITSANKNYDISAKSSIKIV